MICNEIKMAREKIQNRPPPSSQVGVCVCMQGCRISAMTPFTAPGMPAGADVFLAPL